MRTLLLSAGLLLLAAPARADECDSQCATESSQCRKECNGDQACLRECDESATDCPKMCHAIMKAGSKKDIEKAIERLNKEKEDERDARSKQADLNQGKKKQQRDDRRDKSRARQAEDEQ